MVRNEEISKNIIRSYTINLDSVAEYITTWQQSVISQTAIQHYSAENLNDRWLFKNLSTQCPMIQWQELWNIFYRSFEAKYILQIVLQMSTVTDCSASVVQMSHYQHQTISFASNGSCSLCRSYSNTTIHRARMQSHFCSTKIKSVNISKYQTDILWSNA